MTRTAPRRLAPFLMLGLLAGLPPASASAAEGVATLASGGVVSTAPGWLSPNRVLYLRWSKPDTGTYNRIEIRALAGADGACPAAGAAASTAPASQTLLKKLGPKVIGVAIKLPKYLVCYDVTVFYVTRTTVGSVVSESYASAPDGKGTVRKAVPGPKGNRRPGNDFAISGIEPGDLATVTKPTTATTSISFVVALPPALFEGEAQGWSFATVARLKANVASTGTCAFPGVASAYHADGRTQSVRTLLTKFSDPVDGKEKYKATVTGLAIPPDGYCRGFRITVRDIRNRVAIDYTGAFLRGSAPSSSPSVAP